MDLLHGVTGVRLVFFSDRTVTVHHQTKTKLETQSEKVYWYIREVKEQKNKCWRFQNLEVLTFVVDAALCLFSEEITESISENTWNS